MGVAVQAVARDVTHLLKKQGLFSHFSWGLYPLQRRMLTRVEMPQADLSSLHSSPCSEESKCASRDFLPSQFLPARVTWKDLDFSIFCQTCWRNSLGYLLAPLLFFAFCKGLCLSCVQGLSLDLSAGHVQSLLFHGLDGDLRLGQNTNASSVHILLNWQQWCLYSELLKIFFQLCHFHSL